MSLCLNAIYLNAVQKGKRLLISYEGEQYVVIPDEAFFQLYCEKQQKHRGKHKTERIGKQGEKVTVTW